MLVFGGEGQGGLEKVNKLVLFWLVWITFSTSRISDYMDLTPVDIVGKRCYHFIHAEDVEGIRHSHLDCEYCNMLLLAVQDMCYSCTLKKCILKLKSYYDRRLQLAERVNGAAHEEQIK